MWDRLLRYCQETKRDGVPLSQQQDVRDSLADIYIKTEIQRLFGLRNFWLTYARKPKSYEGPQLSYFRKTTGLWMTGAILDAVGPPRSRPIPRGAPPPGSSRPSSATASCPCIPAGRPTSSACRWLAGSGSDGRRGRRPARSTGRSERRHMDLALTESQELLRTTARSFMEREAPVDVIVGLQKLDSSLAPDLWQKAARLRWLGILIPAEYGGSGERLSDAAVLYEMGRGPCRVRSSARRARRLTVLEGASEEQRRRILPGVATGERACWRWPSPKPNASWGPGGITLTPQGRNGSYVLNGTKLFVADATSATDLVVAVRTGEGPADVSLLHVDAKTRGVTTRRLPGFVSWQCEVSFDNVVVPASALLGDAQRGWAALSRALERRCRSCVRTSWAPARRSTRSPSPTRRAASSSVSPSAGSSACRTT